MYFITINNKNYDPYFILDVTKDDTYDDISKSFRKKVKKYHPDKYTDKKQKEKYECYFNILTESFEYIKNKRTNVNDLQINRKKQVEMTKEKEIFVEKSKEKEKEKFVSKNKEREEEINEKSDCKRLNNAEEYFEFKPSYHNPLSKKKFTNKEFNQIFQYNKKIQEFDQDELKEKSLIHITTDGFNGFNYGQPNNNCALVSSYNGLMVTGDNESSVGYWDNSYSDYKLSFKFSAKNPNSKLKINKDIKNEKLNKDIKNEKLNEKVNEKISQSSGSFKQQQQNFVKNTYESLLKKEEKDKEIILKHLHQYDNDTIKKALNGELEVGLKYSSVLQKYLTY
jgi:curved DNA-binding protein CbpA